MLLAGVVCILQCLLFSTNAEVSEQMFSQLLDHNAETKTYWDQKYYVNNEHWAGNTNNTIVFLMVGGEGAISEAFMTYGFWIVLAEIHKPLLFQLEHRYYGASHPTSDVSDDNLIKYLSSQMALADINYFISEINKAYQFDESVKWVLFGGSYSANLAAWARLKYPEAVFAAVASSGPLEAKVNFNQYFDVAAKALDYYSPGCAGEVTKAVLGVQKIFDSNNLTALNEKFETCENAFDMSNQDDRVYFMDQVVGNIAKQAVQYNKQIANGIDQVCSYLNNQSVPDPVDRLSKYYKSAHSGCIFAKDATLTAVFKRTGWNDQFTREDLRQWRFQLCNQFGYFQTSETNVSLFATAFPSPYYTGQCTAIFGANFNATQLQTAVDNTNEYYGGRDIKVTRVAFVQGLLDPWYPLGMINNPTKDSPLYTEYASHTFDSNSPSPDDPPSVTLARKNVGDDLRRWLTA